MPKISVVIPTYNRSNLICKAIESVLAQTYIDFEIIVIDDGSTDNTRNVLLKYNSVIKYIVQKHSGPSAARNVGIRAAAGEYVCFLDADDMYLPEKLETEIKGFRDDSNPDIVYSWYKWIDENDHPLPGATELIVSDRLKFKDIFLFNNFFLPPGAMFKKYCFSNVGYFNEHLTAVEDWDLMLRLSIANLRIKPTKKILYLYRYQPTIQSVNNDIDNVIRNTFNVIDNVYNDSIFPSEKFGLKNAIYSKIYYEWSSMYYYVGNQADAMRYLAKSIEVEPSLFNNSQIFYTWAYGCIHLARRTRAEMYMHLFKIDAYLREFIDYFFRTRNPNSQFIIDKNAILTSFYTTFAMLNYMARNMRVSLKYFIYAFRLRPSLVFNPVLLVTFMKALCGKNVVYLFSQAKRVVKGRRGDTAVRCS